MKNIEEYEDSEIEALIVETDLKLTENPESVKDEEQFSNDELVDLITMIHYLTEAGIVEQAESLYGNTYKLMLVELQSRLGEIPYRNNLT
jgi:hypothetical protein